MRSRRAVAAFACLVAALVWGGAAVAADCAPGTVGLRGDWGQASFRVEIADTPQSRARGLMHRPHLPQRAGMLFVYDHPQQVAFWMRNTLIPLDMIFTDARGVVTRVHSNAIPGDETPIPGKGPVLTVLEINGGLAATLGIAAGTQLQHPSFGADAAWPCP